MAVLLWAFGGPLYSWNLMVLVFGCDLDLDFFLFLSLPGASERCEDTAEIGDG